MNRRSFLAAVASALVAARAPRIAAAAPSPRLTGEVGLLVDSGFFHLGDVITFGDDPLEYRVTAIARDCVEFSPVAASPTDAWVTPRVYRARKEVLTPRGGRVV